MRNIFKERIGLTIPEALIVATLFSLLFGACLMILVSGSDSWQVNRIKIEVQQEVRKAIEAIKADLVQGGSSTIEGVPADDNWYTTITFKVPSGVSGGAIVWPSDKTQFLLSGPDSNELRRKVGTTSKTSAHFIETLQFRRLAGAPNIVEVNLEGEKATMRGRLINLNTTFKVKLRN